MIDRFHALALRPRIKIRTRLREEKGATATEYGIVTAFIVVIVLAGVSLFGLALTGWYNELTTYLKLVLGIP